MKLLTTFIVVLIGYWMCVVTIDKGWEQVEDGDMIRQMEFDKHEWVVYRISIWDSN